MNPLSNEQRQIERLQKEIEFRTRIGDLIKDVNPSWVIEYIVDVSYMAEATVVYKIKDWPDVIELRNFFKPEPMVYVQDGSISATNIPEYALNEIVGYVRKEDGFDMICQIAGGTSQWGTSLSFRWYTIVNGTRIHIHADIDQSKWTRYSPEFNPGARKAGRVNIINAPSGKMYPFWTDGRGRKSCIIRKLDLDELAQPHEITEVSDG